MRISDWSSDVCSSDLLIEEGAPFALAIGADAGRRVEREHLDMRLDAERVDRNAAFAETFEQAQHVGAMFRMLRLPAHIVVIRSEEHTSELQSLMRISYAVFCLKKKTQLHHR